MTIHQLGADDWSLSDTKVEVENVVIAGRLSLAPTGPHALATPIANDKLMWYVIMHLTFVVSAVMMGVLDKMSFASHRDDH